MDDELWTRKCGLYFAPDGEELSLAGWQAMQVRRREDDDESWWRVGQDDIGPYHVSTVWVGINGLPLIDHPSIFESLVFGEGPLAGEEDRYATWDEAQAGHARLVELCRLEVAAA